MSLRIWAGFLETCIEQKGGSYFFCTIFVSHVCLSEAYLFMCITYITYITWRVVLDALYDRIKHKFKFPSVDFPP